MAEQREATNRDALTQTGVPPRRALKKSARSLVAAQKRAGRSLIIAREKSQNVDDLARVLYEVPTPETVREANGMGSPEAMPFEDLYMNGFGTDVIYFQRLARAAIAWMEKNGG